MGLRYSIPLSKYSQVQNEREGCPNKKGDQKKMQNLINRGFNINRQGLEFENRLNITL